MWLSFYNVIYFEQVQEYFLPTLQRPREWPQKSWVTPAGVEALLQRIKRTKRRKEKNCGEKTLKKHEYVLLWV